MSQLPKQLADLSPAERELLAQRLRKQSGATRRARAITRRTDAASTAPLSFAQQRLWVIDQLESGTFAYNLPTVVRFKGRLNVKALEAALNQIIRRHEILRTVFTTADGRPAQAVVPVAPLGIPILSLSGIPESKQMSETLRLAREELERPFDLARWPLLRIKLLQLAEEDNVALLTIHHIISDAWSFDIFVGELGLLYKASLDGSPSPLPELPIQYAILPHGSASSSKGRSCNPRFLIGSAGSKASWRCSNCRPITRDRRSAVTEALASPDTSPRACLIHSTP